ncbi:MAG: hypothetical protein AAF694_01850 [Bacteroidota bacterium]
MKRMFVMALVCFLGIHHATHAQDKTTHAIQLPQVLTVQPAEKVGVYNLFFNGPVVDKLILSLYDSDGNLLSNKSFRDMGSFELPYNLRNAGAGHYTWVAKSSLGTVEQSLTYTGVPNPEIRLVANQEAKKLKLILDDATQEPLTVSIFDERQRLLHTQTVSAEDYEQYYNLEQLNGSYVTFVVTNPTGKSSKESVVLR